MGLSQALSLLYCYHVYIPRMRICYHTCREYSHSDLKMPAYWTENEFAGID